MSLEYWEKNPPIHEMQHDPEELKKYKEAGNSFAKLMKEKENERESL